MRSVKAERSKSCASTSKSCCKRVLMPWKSYCGCGSNHSKSTLSVSKSFHGQQLPVPDQHLLYLFVAAFSLFGPMLKVPFGELLFAFTHVAKCDSDTRCVSCKLPVTVQQSRSIFGRGIFARAGFLLFLTPATFSLAHDIDVTLSYHVSIRQTNPIVKTRNRPPGPVRCM